MKKLIIVSAFLLAAGTASAGDAFGASLKPTPSLTLFGQKISWPIPSLCLGAKAGVTPDASVSPEGLKLKIPYLSLELPFPSIALRLGANKAKVKVGAVETNKRK